MSISRHAVLASVLVCVSACGRRPRSQPDGGRPMQAWRRVRRVQGRRAPTSRPAAPMAGVIDRASALDVDGPRSPDDDRRVAARSPSTCRPGLVYAAIDGEIVAELAIHVGGPAYRGDLLGNGGDLHLPLRRRSPTR